MLAQGTDERIRSSIAGRSAFLRLGIVRHLHSCSRECSLLTPLGSSSRETTGSIGETLFFHRPGKEPCQLLQCHARLPSSTALIRTPDIRLCLAVCFSHICIHKMMSCRAVWNCCIFSVGGSASVRVDRSQDQIIRNRDEEFRRPFLPSPCSPRSNTLSLTQSLILFPPFSSPFSPLHFPFPSLPFPYCHPETQRTLSTTPYYPLPYHT